MAFVAEEIEKLPAEWEAKYLDCLCERYTYSLQFIKDGLTLNVLIPEKYPEDHPVIEMAGKDLENAQEDMKRRIMQSVYELAKVYVGQPMLSVLLEEIWTMTRSKSLNISKVGNQCVEPTEHTKKQKKTDVSHDVHRRTNHALDIPKKKPLNNSKTNEFANRKKGQKLPSMKTAKDVINRLKWDEQLKDESFIVGYEDRFEGIIEVPVWSLNWEDDIAATGPNDKLAIPEHRIQHFKWNSEIVWERVTRTDFMFGSTGSGCDIVEFIKRYKAQMAKDTQRCHELFLDEQENDDVNTSSKCQSKDQSPCNASESGNSSCGGNSMNLVHTDCDSRMEDDDLY